MKGLFRLLFVVVPVVLAGCGDDPAGIQDPGGNPPPPPPPVDTSHPGTNGAVVFASYLGGGQYEVVRDIATDAAGNAYLTGGTESSNFPTTPGALQRVANPGSPENNTLDRLDAFIVKMDPNGNIVWSTLLGGPNYDRAYGIVVDAQGFVYVAGRAGRGFPVTPGAFQTTFQGGQIGRAHV